MRSGLKEDNPSMSMSETSKGSVKGRRGAEYLGVYWPPGTDHVLGGADGVGGGAEQAKMPWGWLNNAGFDE